MRFFYYWSPNLHLFPPGEMVNFEEMNSQTYRETNVFETVRPLRGLFYTLWPPRWGGYGKLTRFGSFLPNEELQLPFTAKVREVEGLTSQDRAETVKTASPTFYIPTLYHTVSLWLRTTVLHTTVELFATVVITINIFNIDDLRGDRFVTRIPR